MKNISDNKYYKHIYEKQKQGQYKTHKRPHMDYDVITR